MGQAEVLKLLSDKKIRTGRQIAKEIGCSYKSANTSARRLEEWGEIETEIVKINNYWVKIYGIA
ncbi:MAG: hypothetical protein ACOC56_06630 [Atribacterota bacterium]